MRQILRWPDVSHLQTSKAGHACPRYQLTLKPRQNMTKETEQLTEAEQTARGQEIARVLQLKHARDQNGKRYKPERYNTTHGTKTALGLFRTLEHLLASPAPLNE